MQTSATILLIDDDADLRAACAIALEHAGHHVVQSASWEDARVLVRESGVHVALVVTDLVMPDAGTQAFGRLQEESGPVPVVVLSGYPRMMKLLDGVLDGVVEWLRKPIEAEALVEAASRALGAAAAVRQGTRPGRG